MPARTNSERIETAEKEILRQDHLLRNFEDRYRIEITRLKTESHDVMEKLQELTIGFATLEQRVVHLEKLLDEGRTRRWQVWLAVLGAIFSAIIALIVALVKK